MQVFLNEHLKRMLEDIENMKIEIADLKEVECYEKRN